MPHNIKQLKIKQNDEKSIYRACGHPRFGGVNAQQIEVYRNGELEQSFLSTSKNEYKVVFKEEVGTINGYHYVEIGGLKWATMNVGATTIADSPETSYGDYYAWGEIDTYYKNKVGTSFTWGKSSDLTYIKGTKTAYNAANYCGGADDWDIKEWTPAPYGDNRILKPQHDAAKFVMGGKWRMPTNDDFKKLKKACGVDVSSGSEITPSNAPTTITDGGLYWVAKNSTIDGQTYNVDGALFVSQDDKTQRLFFPAASYIHQRKYPAVAELCSVWMGEIDEYDTYNGFSFFIKKSQFMDLQSAPRFVGMPVRAVAD